MRKFTFLILSILFLNYCVESIRSKEKQKEYALEFDGVNDFVEIKDLTNTLDTGIYLTIEAWFQTTDPDREQSIIMHGFNNVNGKNNLLKIHDKKLRFNVRGLDYSHQDAIGETNLQKNRWYHGAFTYNGTTGKLFLNGNLEAILKTEINMNMNSRVLIGAFNNPLTGFIGFYFSGMIDEVRIWNVVRSQKDIKDNMKKHFTGNENGLVAYYNFNKGDGQKLIDHAGNNSGTLGFTFGEDESDPVWFLKDFMY